MCATRRVIGDRQGRILPADTGGAKRVAAGSGETNTSHRRAGWRSHELRSPVGDQLGIRSWVGLSPFPGVFRFDLHWVGSGQDSTNWRRRGAYVVMVPPLPAWALMRLVARVNVTHTIIRTLRSRFLPVFIHAVVTVTMAATIVVCLPVGYWVADRTLT